MSTNGDCVTNVTIQLVSTNSNRVRVHNIENEESTEGMGLLIEKSFTLTLNDAVV